MQPRTAVVLAGVGVAGTWRLLHCWTPPATVAAGRERAGAGRWRPVATGLVSLMHPGGGPSAGGGISVMAGEALIP